MSHPLEEIWETYVMYFIYSSLESAWSAHLTFIYFTINRHASWQWIAVLGMFIARTTRTMIVSGRSKVMLLKTHINQVLSSCFGPSSGLCHHMRSTLVTRLVHCRLDYCNVVLAGLLTSDLQTVLSATVRLVSVSVSSIITQLPCNTVVTGPSLAACPAACTVQAVYAGPSLSVWKISNKSDRAHHPDFSNRDSLRSADSLSVSFVLHWATMPSPL